MLVSGYKTTRHRKPQGEPTYLLLMNVFILSFEFSACLRGQLPDVRFLEVVQRILKNI
jgi:hypothetical protein